MKNSSHVIIYKWKKENKLYMPEFKSMLECYRRLHMFHNGNIDANLLLLSLPSEAKKAIEKGLIVGCSKSIPRALNWYELTEKGQTLIKKLNDVLKWNEKEMNVWLFTF
jgi:hypothetical protein